MSVVATAQPLERFIQASAQDTIDPRDVWYDFTDSLVKAGVDTMVVYKYDCFGCGLKPGPFYVYWRHNRVGRLIKFTYDRRFNPVPAFCFGQIKLVPLLPRIKEEELISQNEFNELHASYHKFSVTIGKEEADFIIEDNDVKYNYDTHRVWFLLTFRSCILRLTPHEWKSYPYDGVVREW